MWNLWFIQCSNVTYVQIKSNIHFFKNGFSELLLENALTLLLEGL